LPYREEAVEFASAGGVRLAGTLTLPPGRGPHPAVVLVSGSGPHDRDGAMMGHRPFLVLADHLTRSGVAVLRVDDRGTGGSEGSFADATLEDFADDVLGAVRYLEGRREVARGRIGLAGHSEGAVVAPLAAARPESGVAFVVMLAGTGVPGDSILRLQTDLLMRASGIPPERSARLADAQVRMFGALRRAPDGDEAARRLREAATAFVGEFSEEERRAAALTVEQVEALVRSLLTPALRTLLDHDPAAVLRGLAVPVLALNGGRDLQVPPKENLDAIAAALESGGNRDFSVVELPGLNHLFQSAATGAPHEYARIEETFSPDALRLVSGWIAERFGRAR
ncbi:MAG TPA: CocE/NonD family hydrolase, partial [Longimicrobiaceae bacterium]|nr:CocE/NonD family hydrolase [Longimicrobiaceae bacterium]